MAIDLKTLSKPSGQRPIIATIFGEGGMGKTTLASMFNSPVIIRTEDGTASLTGNDNVSLFPLATSSQDVLDAIEAARVFARAARGKVPPKGQRLDHVDWFVAIATIICRAGSNQKALKVDRCRCAGARST